VTMAASVSMDLPPSMDICRPTPPRYRVSDVVGSIVIFEKYIGRGFALFTRVHVAPPSSERQRPLVWLLVGAFEAIEPPAGALAAGASTSEYTTLGLEREMSTAIRPSSPPGYPPSTRAQVSPPSTDLNSPLPGPPPLKQHSLRRRW